MELSGDTEKLGLVHTSSFRSLRLCRKNKKTETQSLNHLSFGSFCTTGATQKTFCGPGLINALSAKSPIGIYRALICLTETSLQDKVRIINVFQTYSPHRTSYVKSQERKYYPFNNLILP